MLICNKNGKCIAHCDNGWFGIGASCFKIETNKMSYLKAQKACKIYGNNVKLIEVKSDKIDQGLIQQLNDNNYSGNRFWTGIKIGYNGGIFYDSDNSTAHYIASAPYVPLYYLCCNYYHSYVFLYVSKNAEQTNLITWLKGNIEHCGIPAPALTLVM